MPGSSDDTGSSQSNRNHVHVLAAMDEDEPRTLQEISNGCGWPESTVSDILDELVEQGKAEETSQDGETSWVAAEDV